MLRALVPLVAAAPLLAGVVQGVVLEHATGRSLARTVVRLDPIPEPGGGTTKPVAIRTSRSGQFVFTGVRPGLYLLTALRDGYFPASHGQRLPIGRGTPIRVTADSDFFTELRPRRKGALTGRVLDENGVATAGFPVVAYPARLPLRSAGSGKSDDRGVYRIPGLDPGKYWVRSGAHTLEDGSGWLPTFGPQSRESREAKVHRVTVDADTTDADLSPEQGSLVRLSGLITCDTEGPVIVTLSSETGRRQTNSGCGGGYRFDGLAPGSYEILATLPGLQAAAFVDLNLTANNDAVTLQLQKLDRIGFRIRRAGTRSPLAIPIKLFAQRLDASGQEPMQPVGAEAHLAPGYWGFRAETPRGQYVESITNPWGLGGRQLRSDRAVDWFQVFISPRSFSELWVNVASDSSHMEGRVQSEGKPVPGAPVFLWPMAAAARRSLGGYFVQTLTGVDGRFQFDSVPPGEYRLLSSFDIFEPDEELIEQSNAIRVKAEASQTAQTDLPVWVAPW